MHQACLGHLARRDLERKLNGGAGGQALAVGLCVMVHVEGGLVDDGTSLLDAFQLLGRADRRLGGVSRHVEGDASAVLDEWSLIRQPRTILELNDFTLSV